MSSPFQKVFTEKKIKATSPLLNSYERGGVGDIYVSNVASIQEAVGSVQNAINSYINEDSQHKADRLADRVTRRKGRLSHKDEEDKSTRYRSRVVITHHRFLNFCWIYHWNLCRIISNITRTSCSCWA